MVLEDHGLEQSAWVQKVARESKELNDLAHGGGLHLRGRIGADMIEPQYPIRHLEWLVAHGIEVFIRIGHELFGLTGDRQGRKDLETYVNAHFDRPPL